MAHQAQRQWFEKIKQKFPDSFKGKRVLDCGSLDVNGSLKDLFTDCEYIGIDIHPGNNVHVVIKAHEYWAPKFDTLVSAEMLEHDEYYQLSLQHMYHLLKPGGLMAISAAGKGRAEHGNHGENWGTSPDYYRNLLEEDIRGIFDLDSAFSEYAIEYNPQAKDIYFYGVKVAEPNN